MQQLFDFLYDHLVDDLRGSLFAGTFDDGAKIFIGYMHLLSIKIDRPFLSIVVGNKFEEGLEKFRIFAVDVGFFAFFNVFAYTGEQEIEEQIDCRHDAFVIEEGIFVVAYHRVDGLHQLVEGVCFFLVDFEADEFLQVRIIRNKFLEGNMGRLNQFKAMEEDGYVAIITVDE